MSDKRRALGRGLGALIPAGSDDDRARPVDMFFGRRPEGPDDPGSDPRTVGVAAREWPFARSGQSAGDAGLRGDGTPGARADEAAALLTGRGGAVPGSGHEPTQGGLRPVPGASFAELPVAAIRPNPRQPRVSFDEDELDELVQSIRTVGLLQPVVVRPSPSPGGDPAAPATAYELVMGERRWRAVQAAGMATIPAIVRETQDDALLRDALLENLHRSQLNPLEEAAAYQQLLEDFGCSHEELATRIGRSRPQISNTIRLLKLPPLVARRVAAGVLSAGHARALLGLPDGAAMERMAQRVVAEGLSVRSTEEQVSLGAGAASPPRRRPKPGGRHPQLDEIAANLSDRLDTRVLVALGQRKGRITIEFASMDDLQRVVAMLG